MKQLEKVTLEEDQAFGLLCVRKVSSFWFAGQKASGSEEGDLARDGSEVLKGSTFAWQ